MRDYIYNEIFDMRYRINSTMLDFIKEELSMFDMDIFNICDYDHSIIIKYGRHATNHLLAVEGELRIDRITKKFYISGYCDGYLLPATGGWDTIIDYLHKLIN